MNVLNRSYNVVNILKRTISHKNDLLKYSFNYYSKYYTTKGPKTEEITDTLTMNATTENTSVDVPNYRNTWSRSQRSRLDAIKGPRFEQTDLEAQPRPLAAIDLIAEEPIRYVEGRVAVCHGGKGALGHPQIYINLREDGVKGNFKF
ncbi:15242_t:CDS:2 [Rhizophagus irregularis]|nr:15242_t:CDS:2 [Rhizophagus irregularis]